MVAGGRDIQGFHKKILGSYSKELSEEFIDLKPRTIKGELCWLTIFYRPDTACAGCGPSLAASSVTASGPNTIVVNNTGCLKYLQKLVVPSIISLFKCSGGCFRRRSTLGIWEKKITLYACRHYPEAMLEGHDVLYVYVMTMKLI